MHGYPDSYCSYKMKKPIKISSKKILCKHFQSILKQLLKEFSHQEKCADLKTLKLHHPYNSLDFKIFNVPNLEYVKEKIPDCTENVNILADCQSAIHAITRQNNGNNHHNHQ